MWKYINGEMPIETIRKFLIMGTVLTWSVGDVRVSTVSNPS